MRKETPVKERNFVVKHSVNKSGSGRHTSAKDYKRKNKRNNKVTNHE